MKYSLLDVVQNVLSSMDSDEVNSISDTVESLQVARLAREAYLDITSNMDIPERYGLFELDAIGNTSYPIFMRRPSIVDDLLWLKYNIASTSDPRPQFEPMTWLDPTEFLNRMHSLNSTDNGVETFDYTLNGGSITFLYRSDKAPEYWTSFDEDIIVFDSHDITVDTTLQKTKSLGYGTLTNSFTMTDTFVPAIDDNLHQLWLKETKALAFAELKQTNHMKAEKEARRGWIKSQRHKQNTPRQLSLFDQLPYYGRK